MQKIINGKREELEQVQKAPIPIWAVSHKKENVNTVKDESQLIDEINREVLSNADPEKVPVKTETVGLNIF